MAIVYLGLGSNIGNRQNNLKLAIQALKDYDVVVEKTSTFIETEPVGGPAQRKYINAVVKTRTNHSPEILLIKIKDIEKHLGRKKTVRNGPRIIDIDILIYDRTRLHLANLVIPHPRMTERSFVMTPLEEIEPDLAQELKRAHH